MSFLLSSVSKSIARNTVLARHAQNIARLSATNHPIQLNKYQNKFETSKYDAKLIKSFSTNTPQSVPGMCNSK